MTQTRKKSKNSSTVSGRLSLRRIEQISRNINLIGRYRLLAPVRSVHREEKEEQIKQNKKTLTFFSLTFDFHGFFHANKNWKFLNNN